MKKWLSVSECAEYLGVSVHTLYQWAAKRTVPHSKVPKSNLLRFDREEIDEWIRSGSVETMAEAIKGGDA